MANAAIARLRSIPLPLAIAAMTGISIVLIAFMLPAGVLEALAAQSGLPAFLSAAEPPLGATARGLVGVTGGSAMALATWVLLRALEGLPNIRMPRFNRGANGALFARADAAPSKPAESEHKRRRPILAGSDLGAPFHSVRAEAARVPPPAAKQPIIFECAAEPAPERADPDPDWLLDAIPAASAEPEIVSDPEPVAEPASAESAPMAFAPDQPEMVEDEPVASEPIVSESPAVAPPPAEPVADPSAAPIQAERRPTGDESIAALVQRLEAGLERRKLALASSRDDLLPASEPVIDPAPIAPDIDAALRDALGTLQRMTARGR